MMSEDLIEPVLNEVVKLADGVLRGQSNKAFKIFHMSGKSITIIVEKKPELRISVYGIS